MNENAIGDIVVESAVHLHRSPGPGLLEMVYEVTRARELEKRGITRTINDRIESDLRDSVAP